jgi:eukaryotic-like serine/threonine-protein kinase
MDSIKYRKAQTIFNDALDLPENSRKVFVLDMCKDDPELRDVVLALLEADKEGNLIFEREIGFIAYDVFDSPESFPKSLGSYRIIRLLGRGGMGNVYLALHEELNRQVALKILRDASVSSVRLERFKQEERVLAQLTHPAIARLYDASIMPDGTPFFVMEYADGLPITEYCTIHACTLEERLRLFRSVCEAVQYAHRQAIIHRDIKPSNIFVTNDGSVKLLDFGIAKQLENIDTEAMRTQTGFRLMTPLYAAPEQIRGESTGVYTDVYALGVLLYELLALEPPHSLENIPPSRISAYLLDHVPEKVSVKAANKTGNKAGIPEIDKREWNDLDVLCMKAMHRDIQRRYQTVESLIRDIDNFLARKPLEARPDSFGYKMSKFIRRNKHSVAASSFLLLTVIILIAYYTVQITRERNLARIEAKKATIVSDYLISLFEAGDPYTEGQNNPDVHTLLERGEQRAEELSDQPEVQASMLNVLGRVYTQLSDYERARPLLERSIDIRRKLGDPLDIAQGLSDLSSLLVNTGDYHNAEKLLREAIGLMERRLPANHRDLAMVYSDLGSILVYKGEYNEAEMLQRDALRIHRTIQEKHHEALGDNLNGLAVALFQMGDYEEAERYYLEAFDIKRAVFGSNHVRVTRVLANLGKLYEETGKYDIADSLLNEALQIRREKLGNNHYETAVGLSQLATVQILKGELERAEENQRESLAIRQKILEPNHPGIGTAINNLALTLERKGVYDEAATLYAQAAEIYSKSLGERHRFTAIVLCNLAQVFYLKGELDTAYTYYKDGISILEEVHTHNHQELAHNRAKLGMVLTAKGRYAEAETLLVRAYETLDSQLGSTHLRTQETARHLVELYDLWNKPELAFVYRKKLEIIGD